MTPPASSASSAPWGSRRSCSPAASPRAMPPQRMPSSSPRPTPRCDVSAVTATSGTLAFDVTNAGDDVTEFYLLADDGLRIVGEAENIAPGASRTLTVVAQPGEYFTVCKPGMIGEGVGRTASRVSGDAVAIDGPDAEQKQQAVDLYAAFVKDQVSQLVPQVEEFAAAYESGSDDAARAAFPQVRAYYERIEPMAEALGDLDPRIDYREVDAVAEGLDWTGFHRIEKDLWVPAQDALNADGETPAWQDWAPSTPRSGPRSATSSSPMSRSSTNTSTPRTSRLRSTRRASRA